MRSHTSDEWAGPTASRCALPARAAASAPRLRRVHRHGVSRAAGVPGPGVPAWLAVRSVRPARLLPSSIDLRHRGARPHAAPHAADVACAVQLPRLAGGSTFRGEHQSSPKRRSQRSRSTRWRPLPRRPGRGHGSSSARHELEPIRATTDAALLSASSGRLQVWLVPPQWPRQMTAARELRYFRAEG